MRRSPWLTPRLLAVSTVVALVAAVATYAVLDGLADDGDGTGGSVEGTVPLEPVDPPSGEDPTFATFEGQPVALSSLRGAPAVVNFFASTCVPCVREMPAFEEVFQQVGDEVRFLGLAVNDRPEDALELVERTGVTYPTADDRDGEVVATLGVTILPTTVLLDDQGEVVAAHSGALDAGELRELLADELGIEA